MDDIGMGYTQTHQREWHAIVEQFARALALPIFFKVKLEPA